MPRILLWAAIAALVALVLAFLVVPSVGAAERPTAETVDIAQVTGDAGWYVVKLADGRVIGLTPPRNRKQAIPAPQVGSATLTGTVLVQGGFTYLRVKR